MADYRSYTDKSELGRPLPNSEIEIDYWTADDEGNDYETTLYLEVRATGLFFQGKEIPWEEIDRLRKFAQEVEDGR